MTDNRQAPDPWESDTDLLDDFLAGDRAAVQHITAWIERIVRLRAWRLQRNDDLVQDVLIELLTVLRAGRFEHRSALKTFVERVTKYRCIDAIRRQRLRTHISLEESREPEPRSHDNPEQELADRDAVRLCHAVLHRLPDNCRQLLRRVLADDVPYEEIARGQDVAVGTIKSRVARCREKANKLRVHLLRTPGAWREGDKND